MVRFRKRRRCPLRVVNETIAAVFEELTYTLNFMGSMLEQGNERAAVLVIEEQRRSLAQRAAAAEAAILPRRRRRLAFSLAGLTAAIAIGSGAFAAFGPERPAPGPARAQAIRLASEALHTAIATEDPQALRALVGGAQETILALTPQAATDPEVRADIVELIEVQETLLKVNPHVPTDLVRRALEIEQKVREVERQASDVPQETPSPEEPARAADDSEAPPASDRPQPPSD